MRERRKELALGWGGEGREKVPNEPDLRVSSTSRGAVAMVPSSFKTAATKFAGALVFQSLDRRVAASILDVFGLLFDAS